eukprot:2922670-Amphidinium_carterae.1
MIPRHDLNQLRSLDHRLVTIERMIEADFNLMPAMAQTASNLINMSKHGKMLQHKQALCGHSE